MGFHTRMKPPSSMWRASVHMNGELLDSTMSSNLSIVSACCGPARFNSFKQCCFLSFRGIIQYLPPFWFMQDMCFVR